MKKSNKKVILVTGAAGFIGSNTCRRLLDDDYFVVGVDNLNLYYSPRYKLLNIKNFFKDKNFYFIKGDVTDRNFLDKIFRRFHPWGVIHLAARAGVRRSIDRPLWYKDDNVSATVTLLELSSKFLVNNFIFISSASVYGETEKIPFKEDQDVGKPLSPYAASKSACELFCHSFYYLTKMPITVLRPFTVYGPGNRPEMALSLFASGIMKEKEIIQHGDGSMKRGYTYIDDVVEGILLALKNPRPYTILNLGADEVYSIKDVINVLEKICQKKAKVRQIPHPIGDPNILWADNTRAFKILGWRPKVSFIEGCRRLIEWQRERNKQLSEKLEFPGLTKRVLIFSLHLTTGITDVEQAIKRVSNYLDHYNFDCIVVRGDKNTPKYERIGNINLHRVGFGTNFDKYIYPILAVRKARQLHNKRRFDLIWGVMGSYYAGLASFLFRKITKNIKYILNLQRGDSSEQQFHTVWFWYLLYKKIYQAADGIQAVFPHLAEQARYFGYKGNIKIIPNGIDWKQYLQEFTKEELINLKLKTGFQADDRILISMVGLVKNNGIENAIKSLQYLPLDIKLLIIGRGPEKNNLKNLVKEIGLNKRVVFIESISSDKKNIYLKMADVFVRPMLHSGLATSIMEALMSGIAVVGSDVGGIRDIIIHGYNGLLCEVNNPKDIARQIKKLLSDDSLREQFRKTGPFSVSREYDWEIVAEGIRGLFESY